MQYFVAIQIAGCRVCCLQYQTEPRRYQARPMCLSIAIISIECFQIFLIELNLNIYFTCFHFVHTVKC